MRRRQRGLFDATFEVLIAVPAWIGFLLAVTLCCVFHYVFPLCLPPSRQDFDPFDILKPVFSMLAWLLGSAVMALWVLAQVWKSLYRR